MLELNFVSMFTVNDGYTLLYLSIQSNTIMLRTVCIMLLYVLFILVTLFCFYIIIISVSCVFKIFYAKLLLRG